MARVGTQRQGGKWRACKVAVGIVDGEIGRMQTMDCNNDTTGQKRDVEETLIDGGGKGQKMLAVASTRRCCQTSYAAVGLSCLLLNSIRSPPTPLWHLHGMRVHSQTSHSKSDDMTHGRPAGQQGPADSDIDSWSPHVSAPTGRLPPFASDEVTGLASPKGPPSSAGNYSTAQVSGTAGIDDLDISVNCHSWPC